MFGTKTHRTCSINTHTRIHISAFGKNSSTNTAGFRIFRKFARIDYGFRFFIKRIKSHR